MGRRHIVAFTLVLALGVGGCSAPSEQVGAVSSPEDRWRPMMDVVVSHMELAPGEKVFGAGVPALFDELPEALGAAVEAAGGEYVGTLSDSGPYGVTGDPEFIAAARGVSRAELQEVIRNVPVGVMLPGAGPGHAPYAAMNALLAEGASNRRTVHFHWGGQYEVEDRSYPIGAEAAAVPTEDLRADSVYERAILDLDYEAMAANQGSFEAAARSGEIHVTTPAGTDIRFRIGDRPVNRQDGDVSAARAERGRVLIDWHVEFPAGALRVAPLEPTVNGVIAFPRSRWGGVLVEGLVLTFESGRVTDIAATSGVEAVEAELEAAGESAAFRELGLGFNPLLTVPDEDPWLPYFGYGAGVVRLSLGDNSELGGAVGGGYVKWVFFLDATLDIDGDRWVQDGRLLRTGEGSL